MLTTDTHDTETCSRTNCKYRAEIVDVPVCDFCGMGPSTNPRMRLSASQKGVRGSEYESGCESMRGAVEANVDLLNVFSLACVPSPAPSVSQLCPETTWAMNTDCR